MTERAIRFFGGKGGVGKTTLAAAGALALAERGEPTLVVSTDPAHSLADVFDTELGNEPRPIADNLWAAQISGEEQAEKRVALIVDDAEQALPSDVIPAVRRHLARAVGSPGTVESALLDRLMELIEQVPATWSRLVVDSAPTGHMLRLLTLPTLLAPWIEGLARQRQETHGFEQLAAGLLDRPRAESDPLLDRLRTRRHRLEVMRERIRTDAVVYLVTVAERVAWAETLRTIEVLEQSELALGRLYVNRVLPAEPTTGIVAERRRLEAETLARIRERFGDRLVTVVPLLPGSLNTTAELRELAALSEPAG